MRTTKENPQLQRLNRLSRRVLLLRRGIERGEATLKALKAKLHYLAEFVVPEMLDEMDWDPKRMEFREEEGDAVYVEFADGLMLRVRESFHPKLHAKETPERMEEMEWLEANGAGDLLTLDVSLSFARGEGKAARAVLAAIAKVDPSRPITKEKTIHYQTLQKFCRERVAAGLELPELLGVFNRRIAEAVQGEPPVAMVDGENGRRGIPPVHSDGYGF